MEGSLRKNTGLRETCLYEPYSVVEQTKANLKTEIAALFHFTLQIIFHQFTQVTNKVIKNLRILIFCLL